MQDSYIQSATPSVVDDKRARKQAEKIAERVREHFNGDMLREKWNTARRTYHEWQDKAVNAPTAKSRKRFMTMIGFSQAADGAFGLTQEQMLRIAVRQGGKCLSGAKFGENERAPAFVRINTNLGYNEDNCAWVMKGLTWIPFVATELNRHNPTIDIFRTAQLFATFAGSKIFARKPDEAAAALHQLSSGKGLSFV